MIEIIIRKENDTEPITLEFKGAGGGFNPKVPGLLTGAIVGYLLQKLHIDGEDALLTLFEVVTTFLKERGIPEYKLCSMVTSTLDMPGISVRH